MILKEIELDLPYIVDEDAVQKIMDQMKITRNEATKLEYKENWKEKRRNFSLQTRCISSMFAREMGKIKTPSCSKIVIECVSKIEKRYVRKFSGIFTVQVQFDYEKFSLLNDDNKKKHSLDLILNGLRFIAKDQEWDLSPFEAVSTKIIDKNYENKWVWKKSKSPNKEYSVELVLNHNVKTINFGLVVTDKKGRIVMDKMLLSELPDEWAYVKHLGGLKWTSDNEITLVNKKGDMSWSASII